MKIFMLFMLQQIYTKFDFFMSCPQIYAFLLYAECYYQMSFKSMFSPLAYGVTYRLKLFMHIEEYVRLYELESDQHL